MSYSSSAKSSSDAHFAFSARFLADRMAGFEKDVRICLTGVPRQPGSPGRRQSATHAYFPALLVCCAALELLGRLRNGTAGLRRGEVNAAGKRAGVAADAVLEYCRVHMPGYLAADIRALYACLRNSAAHMSVAASVTRHDGKRIAWSIHANATRPALRIVPQAGRVDPSRSPPWACAFDHRLHVRLGRLWRDIKASSPLYSRELASDPARLLQFMECMERLYPQ